LIERKCLLVDFGDGSLADSWHERTELHNFGTIVSYTSSVEEAEVMLNSGIVLTLVIFTNEYNDNVERVLKSYKTNVGSICEFQAVVCDDPHPKLLASLFEFTIENFYRTEFWPSNAAAMSRFAIGKITDSDSAIAKTVQLTTSIRSGDQEKIKQAKTDLGDLAEFDYRAAYANGKASEATGDYQDAIDNYASASGMNTLFKGSAVSQSETLLLTGETDKALEILKKLEKQNPYDTNRKAIMATAYIEKGDIAQAAKYVKSAGKNAPKNSKVLEARAQVLLSTGRVAEAFKLIDQMSEVGPFFAAKLNELGIKLSKAGKSKSALAVYQKAHKVVRPELRHKISMNAALACRRLKAFDMALKYLARAEKEYGSKFDKLVKLRKSLLVQKRKVDKVKVARRKAKLKEAKAKLSASTPRKAS
jgi:tetratricopeptide (TPR) repeat protein